MKVCCPTNMPFADESSQGMSCWKQPVMTGSGILDECIERGNVPGRCKDLVTALAEIGCRSMDLT